jgi:hypothetical protein
MGVDLGNHKMVNTRLIAPYAPEIKGVNIVNTFVNPVFNDLKEKDNEERPCLTPIGKIDVSGFKWRNISDWFAHINFNMGECEVIVPEGEYIIGSIQIKSNTTFHLLENAKLLGSRDMADYPIFLDIDPEKFMPDVNYDGRREYTRNWHRGLINIYHSDNISIIGEKNSMIDGRNVFNPDGEENYRGPHL